MNSKRNSPGRVYDSGNIIAYRYYFVTSAIILSRAINQQYNGKSWGRCLPNLTLEILSLGHFNTLAPFTTRITVYKVIWRNDQRLCQMGIIFLINRPARFLESTTLSAKENCLQSGVLAWLHLQILSQITDTV